MGIPNSSEINDVSKHESTADHVMLSWVKGLNTRNVILGGSCKEMPFGLGWKKHG